MGRKVDGGLVFAEPTAKGVMYVTSERANILTFEKGKDVWNKDIKIKVFLSLVAMLK